MNALVKVNDKTAAIEAIQGNLDLIEAEMVLKANIIASEILMRAEDGTVVVFKVVLDGGDYTFKQVQTITGL